MCYTFFCQSFSQLTFRSISSNPLPPSVDWVLQPWPKCTGHFLIFLLKQHFNIIPCPCTISAFRSKRCVTNIVQSRDLNVVQGGAEEWSLWDYFLEIVGFFIVFMWKDRTKRYFVSTHLYNFMLWERSAYPKVQYNKPGQS